MERTWMHEDQLNFHLSKLVYHFSFLFYHLKIVQKDRAEHERNQIYTQTSYWTGAAFTPPLMLSNESLTKKAKKVTGTFFHSDNHEPEYNQTHFLHKEC